HVPVVIVPMEDNEDNVVTAVLTKVPDVGKVTLVAAVVVSVSELAPEEARFSPRGKVMLPLLAPVPPNFGLIIISFHVPVVTVPGTEIFVLPLLIALLTAINLS